MDDPHFYTSVHQWKPTTPEKFASYLLAYLLLPENQDDYGNGLMGTKVAELDRTARVVIHYSKKNPGSSISSPVLMQMTAPGGKHVCFVSTIYGFDAAPPSETVTMTIAQIEAHEAAIRASMKR